MQIFSGQIIWLPLIGYFIFYAFKNLETKAAWTFLLFLILVLIASDVTSSYIIKNLVNRFRPCREIDLKPLIYSFGQKCGGKYGFVSSHAANSFALVIYSCRALNFKKPVFLTLLLVPMLVSYSRIYLGVHYPGDILGGLLVGTSWSLFFAWGFKSSLRS